MCSNLPLNTPEGRQWPHSGVITANFEHVSHLLLLLTLNRKIFTVYIVLNAIKVNNKHNKTVVLWPYWIDISFLWLTHFYSLTHSTQCSAQQFSVFICNLEHLFVIYFLLIRHFAFCQLSSCHSSLSIPPDNIRKTRDRFPDVFRGV